MSSIKMKEKSLGIFLALYYFAEFIQNISFQFIFVVKVGMRVLFSQKCIPHILEKSESSVCQPSLTVGINT